MNAHRNPLFDASTRNTFNPCHPERCARERARESKDPEVPVVTMPHQGVLP